MSVINWTESQLKAIHTIGKTVLVSAAAGSGKTAVLSERCVHLICDGPRRCDVDQLLVVTYTKAAANEMRGRIESKIRERRRTGGKDSADLERQVALIARATIGTIHSFCLGLLRQHFNRVGIDPVFRTLDEHEATLLKNDCARAVLQKHYAGDQGDAFRLLIDTVEENDNSIIAAMLKIFDLQNSLIDPAEWGRQTLRNFDELIEAFDRGDRKQVRNSTFMRVLERLLAGEIDYHLELLKRFDAATSHLPAKDKNRTEWLPTAREALTELASALSTGGVGAMNNAFLEIQERVNNKAPGLSKDRENELARKLRDCVNKFLKKKEDAGFLDFSVEDWVDGLRRTRPLVSFLLTMVDEFRAEYSAAKAQLRSLDFADLEVLTLRLLRTDDPGLVPTDIARSLHTRFHHVLVDEYQDTNQLQDAIFHLVSRECVAKSDPKVESNLFCVGDVKQCIYGFRLAEPEMFLRRYEEFRDPDHPYGCVIDLQENFRSRPELLESLNHLFRATMTARSSGIDYDKSQELNAPRTTPFDPHPLPSPVELHLLPKPDKGSSSPVSVPDENGDDESSDAEDLTSEEREARYVAGLVASLLGRDGGDPMQIVDKSGRRAVKQSDIAILLRSARFHSTVFSTALKDRDIEAITHAGTGFFESLEIRDMLSLLEVLDNRAQDVPLAAFLRSPIVALEDVDTQFLRIRAEFPRKMGGVDVPFHEAVLRYARAFENPLALRLRDILRQLDEWRVLTRLRPSAELIWTILTQTGYLTYAAGMPRGKQRVANLIRFHDLSRTFSQFQRQGLSRFLKFIASLREQQDLAMADVASADNAVSILTVHAAKGLEFPVVIVPRLGGKFNTQDAKDRIFVDRSSGVGVKVVDTEHMALYRSLATEVIQSSIKQTSLREEMRILYVAATRAREKLIFVGTTTSAELEGYETSVLDDNGRVSEHDLLSAKSMMNWILPVALNQSADPARIKGVKLSDAEIPEFDETSVTTRSDEEFAQIARFGSIDVDPLPPTSLDALLKPYPFQELAHIPAAIAVTMMAKAAPRRARETADDPLSTAVPKAAGLARLDSPRFVTPTRQSKPVDIGSATHAFLEHFDFARAKSPADIQAQLQEQVQQLFLTPEDAALVDLEGIEWLCGSSLGTELQTHHRLIEREIPFVYAIDPDVQGLQLSPSDRTVVRGRIDLMISPPVGPVIIDYKTDRIPKEILKSRLDLYRPQLAIYAHAVSSIYDVPVKRACLVFLHLREIVEWEPSK